MSSPCKLSLQKVAYKSKAAIRTLSVLPLLGVDASHRFSARFNVFSPQPVKISLDAKGESALSLRIFPAGGNVRSAILPQLRLSTFPHLNPRASGW